MDIPNMFQPALNRISSIASTAKNGILTRVLSFTGSFNDHTRLLNDAELGSVQAQEEPAPPSSSQASQEAPPASLTAAVHAIDIEAAATAAGEAQEPVAAAQDAETKRVAKSVQTVCLFAASASLVLFVNLPSRDDVVTGAMYSADLAFISLGFFSSLGLSMFSIVARSGETVVTTVQKWGMVVALASVLVAFTLRICMMPVASSS